MLRIDRAKRTMSRLGSTPLAAAGILERNDLQQMIRNTPAEFFAELGKQLLPLGEEIRPSEVVDDRIDLLALDTDGTAVIIELKRGAHKLREWYSSTSSVRNFLLPFARK
jgi:RecB family endonuclease NucS